MTSAGRHVLVVLGATGNQGGSVLRHFAAHQTGYQLRGITRNPDAAAAQELHAIGVDMIRADVNDAESLKQAFAGATHLFATTDSNQIIFDAIQNPEKLTPGQTPNTYAQHIEMQQGSNIIKAAAATSTLKRVVWSSLGGPKKWSKGKYTNVTMFDTKEDIADMFWANDNLRSKLSILIIGFYVTNALSVPKFYAPQKQHDGLYELSLPMSGDVPLPMADVEADVGAWVSALFEVAPNTQLIGASEMLTWEEWLKIWSEVTGVQARYRQASKTEYSSRMEGMGEAVYEEFQFVQELGIAGGNSGAILPRQLHEQGLEIQTSSIAEAIRRLDWSSIL